MLNAIVKTVKKGDYLYGVCPDHPRATKNSYVLLHRLIVENELGRFLTKDEIVHHKDGNKKNNDPSNLEVMTAAEHASLHHNTGRTMAPLVCTRCGTLFEREVRLLIHNKAYKEGRSFCSRSCNGKYYHPRK